MFNNPKKIQKTQESDEKNPDLKKPVTNTGWREGATTYSRLLKILAPIARPAKTLDTTPSEPSEETEVENTDNSPRKSKISPGHKGK